MDKQSFEKIYDWNELEKLLEEFVPEMLGNQKNMEDEPVFKDFPFGKNEYLDRLEIPKEGRDPREVSRELLDKVYPYSMKTNHTRNFSFIPNNVSPYAMFGDVLNTLNNPYGGGINVSKGTALIEEKLIKWMGEKIGYSTEKLGGQFVSGGSMANLTGMIAARDDKLEPEDFIRGTVYVSDQTHSSVAKGVHVMGISKKNVRKIKTDDKFRMRVDILRETIEEDIKNGYRPFLIVATAGTTNTGAIDPLEDLVGLRDEYGTWLHVDGAYGGSAILSSHRHLLKGIENSDSISWDSHKWLYQSYGCASIICRDKYKLLNSFSVNPEYLKDVESRGDEINFWDMGIELTKPVRSMRLWFTLQVVGEELISKGIDRAFLNADIIEREVRKYDDFEIVSNSTMGIINFRYFNKKYSEKELDTINHKISEMGVEEGFAGFLTTELNGKTVLRFCSNHPLTKEEDLVKIVEDIRRYIDRIIG